MKDNPAKSVILLPILPNWLNIFISAAGILLHLYHSQAVYRIKVHESQRSNQHFTFFQINTKSTFYFIFITSSTSALTTLLLTQFSLFLMEPNQPKLSTSFTAKLHASRERSFITCLIKCLPSLCFIDFF